MENELKARGQPDMVEHICNPEVGVVSGLQCGFHLKPNWKKKVQAQ